MFLNYRFAAPCLFGLEAPLAEELRDLSAQNVQAENGRVLFSGDAQTLIRANFCSRYAERILLLIGEFHAATFESLFEGVKALPWERWIGRTDRFPVKGYSLNSRLFSVRDCQSIIKKAVVERLKQAYHIPWFEETGDLYQIQFSILKDHVSLMIDTSGEGLHKRGYRPAANAAPIRETLAAALCRFSHLRGYHTLYDPMCGSGTIPIEGALLALNIAPGLFRDFTARHWCHFPDRLWRQEKERAQSLQKSEPQFHVFASDIDRRSLELASGNARRGGVEKFITFEKADLRAFQKHSEKGTVIVNPPYGERLLDIKEAEEIYRIMGEKFLPERGWTYSIISPDEHFEQLFGRKADKRRKLYNGMIKCQYYMYFKPIGG